MSASFYAHLSVIPAHQSVSMPASRFTLLAFCEAHRGFIHIYISTQRCLWVQLSETIATKQSAVPVMQP
jgi:hypothetical protein